MDVAVVRVLAVNAGSSSLKLRLLDHDDAVLAVHDVESPSGRPDQARLEAALREMVELARAAGGDADGGADGGADGIDAIGHRVVHGGRRFRTAVRVDAAVRQALDELTDLAPLHQPKSLAALDAVGDLLPGVPAVACFDTAFFTDLPERATTYALPRDWRERHGVRRYGFHGLSHASASRRAAELVGRPGDPALRVVVAHLGAGCSLSAVVGGRPVDTTMGFTPLEGLVMSTRSGSVDPGLVLWLEQHEGLPTDEVADALEHRSGLLGLCGTGDMREVLSRVSTGDADACLALDVYVHRLVTGIGSMVAAAGGLDVLVMTGGVGESSSVVRRRAAEGLAFLGVGSPGGPPLLVVPAREDLEIAAQTRQALSP